MCLHPLTIRKETDNYLGRIKFIEKHCKGAALDLLRPNRFSCITVPCGKCFECLKVKQNDLATRCYLEAKSRGSMHFVTLTYDDCFLPLQARVVMVDKSTGEMYSDSNSFDFSDGDFSQCGLDHFAVVQDLNLVKKGRDPRYVYYWNKDIMSFFDYPFYDEGFEYGLKVTPSLRRRDVRLWIKRCRVQYERKFGQKLDFSYVCAGEFGPNTCRPHYHLAFFGLDDRKVNWMLSLWTYGFSQPKKVSCINKDGSNGFLGAARYIGKYISKGAYECSSVINGDAEKPRLMVSIDLGCSDLDDRSMSFYRGYDIVGHYDPSKQFLSDDDRQIVDCVTADDVQHLRKFHEQIYKRQYVEIGKFRYKLPKALLKRIWSVKDSSGVYRSSPLQMVFTSFIQSDLLDDRIAEFRDNEPFASDADLDQFIEKMQVSVKAVAENKESALQKAYLTSFYKSNF